MSFMLSNRDDISLHFRGKTSLKVQMAEYITETKGIPGRKNKNNFIIICVLLFFSIILSKHTSIYNTNQAA